MDTSPRKPNGGRGLKTVSKAIIVIAAVVTIVIGVVGLLDRKQNGPTSLIQRVDHLSGSSNQVSGANSGSITGGSDRK
jgi:hypothetical protein